MSTWVVDRALRRRVGHLTVRVWRHTCTAPQGLFTFAGAFDAAVLGAVMQHVQLLTREIPGPWRVEVVAVAVNRTLLSGVGAALLALRRSGLRARAGVTSRCGTVLRGYDVPRQLALHPDSLPH